MSSIFFFKKPRPETVQRLLEDERGAPLSYPDVEATRRAEPIRNFNNDYQKLPVGHGAADFELAKTALTRWVHFPAHWVEIHPADAKTDPGTELCLLFNLFGTWWTSGSRVVYRTDEARRFGFAYGTLPSHIERGEELFQVEMDDDGVVWYEIRAFSQPRHPLIRVVKPLARLLQEKFRRDSADAVRAFVASSGAAVRKPLWRPDQWILALAFCLLGMALTFPGTFFHHDYGQPILVFAALLSSPLVLHVLAIHRFLPEKSEKLLHWLLPAGAALAAAQVFGQLGNSILASALTLPWLLLASVFALGQVADLRFGKFEKFPKSGFAPEIRAATAAAMVFWVVGAVWAFADPAGIRPFGFSAEITRLTALHFHFAGLALPALAGLAQFYKPNFFGKITVWMIIAGVPLTALGITATQLGAGIFLETLAGVVMSLAGIFTAWRLLGLGFGRGSFWLVAAGFVLFFTMFLSGGYALRAFVFFDFQNLNWMRAVHGSLNALVAVPCALAGFVGLRFRFGKAIGSHT